LASAASSKDASSIVLSGAASVTGGCGGTQTPCAQAKPDTQSESRVHGAFVPFSAESTSPHPGPRKMPMSIATPVSSRITGEA
jgi:hypothetical protein